MSTIVLSSGENALKNAPIGRQPAPKSAAPNLTLRNTTVHRFRWNFGTSLRRGVKTIEFQKDFIGLRVFSPFFIYINSPGLYYLNDLKILINMFDDIYLVY